MENSGGSHRTAVQWYRQCCASRRETSLFKLQSECPFKAFAVLRLGARELEEAETGAQCAGSGAPCSSCVGAGLEFIGLP